MADLFVMESVNLFCGSHTRANSKHLTITELKLPALQEKYADHHPGGARVGIEVSLGIEKLEMGFKLAGVDPSMLTQFGLGSRVNQLYTAYGLVADKKTGEKVEAKAIVRGRLGKIEMDAHKKGDIQDNDYAINEILHYEYHFNGVEKVYWDFFTNAWRIDGADQNALDNAILKIS